MKRNLTLMVIIAINMLSSCVVGRKLSFEGKTAGPDYQVAKKAMIVFQDKREAVLTGREKTSFCGHSNSTMQISYNIQTNSGRPLADEFADAVSAGYSSKGSPGAPFFVNMNTATDSATNAFKGSDKERLVYFIIHKWESRAIPLFISIRYETTYDLELTVYDKTGRSIGSAATHDVVIKEEGGATSIKKMQAMADTIFKDQTARLLNNELIKKSLYE